MIKWPNKVLNAFKILALPLLLYAGTSSAGDSQLNLLLTADEKAYLEKLGFGGYWEC